MTRLQRIKANYEVRYGEKACARHARERFGELPGRGNSKQFWFEVSHRMIQEDRRKWEADQRRRNRQNYQAKQQQSNHPNFARIFNAARSRGYCFTEAEALAGKATEMLKTNPQRAYKLFLNRINIA